MEVHDLQLSGNSGASSSFVVGGATVEVGVFPNNRAAAPLGYKGFVLDGPNNSYAIDGHGAAGRCEQGAEPLRQASCGGRGFSPCVHDRKCRNVGERPMSSAFGIFGTSNTCVCGAGAETERRSSACPTFCAPHGNLCGFDCLRRQGDSTCGSLHDPHPTRVSVGYCPNQSQGRCNFQRMESTFRANRDVASGSADSHQSSYEGGSRGIRCEMSSPLWPASYGANGHAGFDNAPLLTAPLAIDAVPVPRQRAVRDGERSLHVADCFGSGCSSAEHSSRFRLPLTFTWPHRVTVISNDISFPLHVKDIEFLSWDRADMFVRNAGGELWETWKRLTDPFRCVQCAERILEHQPVCLDDVALIEGDLQTLLRHGVLVQVPVHEVRGTCKSFAVLESAKGRRRWILWPKDFNALTDVGDDLVYFPTIEKILSRVSYKYAVCLDMAWFFRQFQVLPEIGKFFALLKGGLAFAPTSIPTGARQPPKFAQLLMNVIVSLVVSEFRPVVGDAFIDNVRLAANDPHVLMAAVLRLFAVCRTIGITVNERLEEVFPLAQYDFLGVRFDHSACCVSLSDKTMAKLVIIKNSLSLWSVRMSTVELQSTFGICVWASSILSLPRAKYYYIYKFYRRHSSFDPDVFHTVWPSILSTWIRWVEELLVTKNRFYAELKVCSAFTIYTDACPRGWGGVAYAADGSLDAVVADSFSPEKQQCHINLLELLAVKFFFLRWIHPRGTASIVVDVVVDNSSTLGQLRKTRSPSYRYNEELTSLFAFLQKEGIILRNIKWVRSLMNPADHWSRLERFFSVMSSCTVIPRSLALPLEMAHFNADTTASPQGKES